MRVRFRASNSEVNRRLSRLGEQVTVWVINGVYIQETVGWGYSWDISVNDNNDRDFVV